MAKTRTQPKVSRATQVKQRGSLFFKHPRYPRVPLDWGQRLDLIDAWTMVIEGVYAHLPLKRSLYGFDPLRALEHLRREVPLLNDLQFHRELTLLINRLRDAHTQYYGARKMDGAVAALPFLVEAYGPQSAPKYVVSKVTRARVKDRRFREGVTIEWWNGIPFERAVELHAERETGGRPDARRARALESLTHRSLDCGPPPDEAWVSLIYRDLQGVEREMKCAWRIVNPGKAPTATKGAARRRRGINPGAEAIRRAKKLLFNPILWQEERSKRGGPAKAQARKFADLLSARTVKTRKGQFGYLRIWSFEVDNVEAFLEEAIELLRGLPKTGLIIDLRNNPGGTINAAERMLQLFTPQSITPTKFAMRATPLTTAIARAPFNQQDFGEWRESLEAAATTGEPYSSHLPITTFEQCNDIGQHYGGPVLAVIDANTYSSGDLFTAGFVDNQLGPVIALGEATGAGGACVWQSSDLESTLRAAESPLPRLPRGATFNVAILRAVRSGGADGVLIEDTGIPGTPYDLTLNDVLDGNSDLIEHCAGLLASEPLTALEVTREGRVLMVVSTGLETLDLYFDGRPAGPPRSIADGKNHYIEVPKGVETVELVAYEGGRIRQRRLIPLK
jgi:hypothetical protein